MSSIGLSRDEQRDEYNDETHDMTSDCDDVSIAPTTLGMS